MAMTKLSAANYVQRGYGQVEPNHLSAQRTGQIYAQLPAVGGEDGIKVLENGQYVKYNYADGVVDFTGAGEWMLVFNEVKVYYDHQADNDFAMRAENYNARVYSPVDADSRVTGQSRHYDDFAQAGIAVDGTNNPFGVETFTGPKMMPEGSTMVPRVFKTNIGDIYTTNMVNFTNPDAAAEDLLGVELSPNESGILTQGAGAEGAMKWQVVKVYTMPDRQRGVKIMRIA